MLVEKVGGDGFQDGASRCYRRLLSGKDLGHC